MHQCSWGFARSESPIYGEPGTSAFMKAWLGLTQLCINPYFQFVFPNSGLYADLVAAFGLETIIP